MVHSESIDQPGVNMSNQPRRSLKLLWTMLAAALVALWPPPAQAGHGARRTPHIGGHEHSQRHGKRANKAGAGARGARPPAPSTSARPVPAGPR